MPIALAPRAAGSLFVLFAVFAIGRAPLAATLEDRHAPSMPPEGFFAAQLDPEFDAEAEFEDANDPLEPVNRGIFEFNRVVDGLFIKPAAQIYRGVLPQEAQDGVRNVLRNLRSPIVLANDLLQGDVDRAGTTIGRFLVNSTVGLLGIFDVASDWGMPYHSEDFGQTLAVWGLDEGPFLILPILGPSNLRDTAGFATEWFVDPVNIALDNNDYDTWIWVRAGLTGVDARARSIDALDELERTSLDYYAAIRSLYRQQRANEIRNNRSADQEPGATLSGAALPDDTNSSLAPQ